MNNKFTLKCRISKKSLHPSHTVDCTLNYTAEAAQTLVKLSLPSNWADFSINSKDSKLNYKNYLVYPHVCKGSSLIFAAFFCTYCLLISGRRCTGISMETQNHALSKCCTYNLPMSTYNVYYRPSLPYLVFQ